MLSVADKINSSNDSFENNITKSQEKKNGEEFFRLLNQARKEDVKEDAKEDPIRLQNSVGIIFKQMHMSGTNFANIMHNGVKMSFFMGEKKDGTYYYETTIGVENKDTKWYVMSTKNGTLKFDLNDLGSVLKCLDMFSPEDAERIMEVIQKQKIANGIEEKLEDFINGIREQIQDKVEENNDAASEEETKETEETIQNDIDTDAPSLQQIDQLFMNVDQTADREKK